HMLDVSVELLRQNHGYGRVDALPHLDLRHDQGDHALLIDPDEAVGLETLSRALCRKCHTVPDGKVEPHQQSPTGSHASLEHRAPRRIDDLEPQLGTRTHVLDPELWDPDARLMASRIRTYVPQRQIFPAMAALISLSLGCGVAANSAAADMICPDWQYPHCTT